MAPPAAKTNCYVSRYTFSAIGTIIVVLGGALLSVSWGTTVVEQRRGQGIDDRQDAAIVDVQLNAAVQGEQLDNIEESIEDLKDGQREILKRLPAQ